MCTYSKDRELDKAVKAAIADGWIPVRKKKHWAVHWPGKGTVTFSFTPSDGRAAQYFKSDCRRVLNGTWK